MILKLRVWDKEHKTMTEVTWNEDTLDIMICTGLTDRTGTLVYEGDIITRNNVYREVFWDPNDAKFLMMPGALDIDDYIDYPTSLNGLENWLVVGNTYEPSEIITKIKKEVT